MNRSSIFFSINTINICVVALLFIACNSKTEMTSEDIEPPIAEKKPHELVNLGDTRIDDYYWMKLTDEQKNAEQPDTQTQQVVAYLNEENKYLEQVMESTNELQSALYEEIVARIKQDDESVPYFENGYWYYYRYEKDKEYRIHCRKKGSLDAEEEIMLDINKLAEGHEYISVSGLNVSPNNRYLAYGTDTVSRRQYYLQVKDLETGEILSDKINNTSAWVAWSNDSRHFFYTEKDVETLRSYKINRHQLGSNSSDDVTVYTEDDETFSSWVYKTKSDKYIVIGSGHTLYTEFRILEADNPTGEFRIFNKRKKDHEYYIEHFKNKFYVISNQDAPNYKLMETPETKTTEENWKEVIAHRSDVLLEDIDVFNNWLVVSERKNGLMNLRIINQTSKDEHYLDFGEEAYVAYTTSNPEFDTDVLRFGYQSMTTPNSTYDYNMSSRQKELLKQQEIVGDFNSENYVTRRVYAPARDGVEIPVSLVHRKGLKLDGNNPTLLYGYGSYGATIDPYFSTSRLSLLDRGFVFVIAHIRGGQINGRQWYEDGKLYKKINTFTDFIDCAEFIIDQGYTNPDMLVAQGGSAGGLLMGAVANMRPDLFKGVVAQVPFVDVITTMLDDDIPLTTFEYDEWGNPNDLEYYEYIKGYSPYDNVTNQEYPNMLVTTGFHDSQVQYWEPAKWVAKLREYNTGNNKILLYTDMEAGHGGASGRFKQYRETAMIYAFMLDVTGQLQKAKASL